MRSAPRRRSTRRSCSGPPRASTRPTGCSATRCSRRPGGRARRSRRCASTRPRTSTAAVARYLELIKLAALVQRPGRGAGRRGDRGAQRAARPGRHARAAGGARGLGARRLRDRRGARAGGPPRAGRRAREPSLEQFIPRRGDGLALSASDIDLYRTCPLKYKFARVFAIPQEPTINQRFGILIHQVLERFHTEELRAEAPARPPVGPARRGREPRPAAGAVRGGLAAHRLRLLRRRAPVPRPRRRGAGPLPRAPRSRSESQPGLAGARASPSRSAPHQLRGRVDRVDRLPDGGYELIDYKTGERRTGPAARTCSSRSTGSAPARRGRSRPSSAATGTCSTTSGSRCRPRPTTPSGSSARCSRSAAGIEGQDFEPRPSYEICSLVRLPPDLPGLGGLRPAAAWRSVASLVRAALAQEALELPGDRRRPTGRPRPELELAPPARPRACATSSSISGLAATARSTCSSKRAVASSSSEASTAMPGQPLQAAQQRQRRLRVGDRGDVVRDRRPEARRGRCSRRRQASWTTPTIPVGPS